MGLLDSFNNPYVQLGMSILANNNGHYGQFSPALSGGFNQFQQMQQFQAQEEMRKKMMDMQQRQMELQTKKLERDDAMDQKRQGFFDSFQSVNKPFEADNPFNEDLGNLQTVQPGLLDKFGKDPKGLASAFMSSGIPEFQQTGLKMLTEKTTPMVLRPGDILADAQGTVIKQFADNKAPEVKDGFQWTPEKGWELVPELYQAGIAHRAAGATRVNTPVVLNQEREEAKTVGKYFGDQYADIQTAALKAPNKIAKYQRLASLLDGVETGKLTPIGVEIASFAKSLGMNIDPKLGNKEAAAALANEMALELRDPSGGAGMPGAMSDKDREYLNYMVPNLSKTPEGRRLMIELAVKLAKRNQEVAQMARVYRKKNGSIDEGFFEELQQFSDKNPLFPQQPKQQQPIQRGYGNDIRRRADEIIRGQ